MNVLAKEPAILDIITDLIGFDISVLHFHLALLNTVAQAFGSARTETCGTVAPLLVKVALQS